MSQNYGDKCVSQKCLSQLVYNCNLHVLDDSMYLYSYFVIFTVDTLVSISSKL